MGARFLIFCFFLINNNVDLYAQNKQVNFSIETQWSHQKLELEKAYFLDTASITISELKFYLSSFKLFSNEVLVFSDSIPAYLFDIENPTSIQLNIPESVDYDEIEFQLGIDSVLTVSGNMAGDLNPQKGMYWAWQSGYINFRVEGQITHQDKQKEDFDFHLGGYRHPFKSAQFIKIKMNSLNQRDVKLTIDIAEVLSYFNLNQLKHLMSPGDKAVEFSKVISKKFILSKP
jgi:hypothetical protein